MSSPFPVGPFYLSGTVVPGFQRGSKTLGFPTANLDPQAFAHLTIAPGVYFGFVSIANGPVFKTMLSVGWNPFFKNQEKTVEAWIDHEFEKDFYGEEMKLVICGWIREQKDFSSLDELIQAINSDIEIGRQLLDKEPYSSWKPKIIAV